MSGSISEQIKAKDFKQFNTAFTFVRRGVDKIWVTLGHEEMERIAPPKSLMVIDCELVLSIADAEQLVSNVSGAVNAMKNVVVTE